MTSRNPGHPPTADELNALLRLLDDETPEVRNQVAARLQACGGDISEHLAAQPVALSPRELATLSRILAPQRRINIEADWLVPSNGAASLREDWELFEALLRILSDYLHDGTTCRQPLSDALDLLAEEAQAAEVNDPLLLAEMLFKDGPLRGNHEDYEDPRNSDLAWCIAEGRSNPIGLCTILLLVARRLDLPVEGVNFPGHFLCRIYQNGHPLLVDCFNGAALHDQAAILNKPEISRSARALLRQPADPGAILMRTLNNLHASLLRTQRTEDAALVARLRKSLG